MKPNQPASPFEEALSRTRDALAGLRDNPACVLPRASRAALERLVNAQAAPEPVPVVPSPETPAPAALSAEKPAAPELRSSAPPAPAKSSVPVANKAEALEALRNEFIKCQKCQHLVKFRSNVVFGVGNPEARLMFVGEAPGADEDIQGEPFVGKAGQLLTKIIEAMGFKRSDVYIANVLKCRPDMPPGESGNRKPRPEEMATCLPYLIRQIEIIQPECLVALGATAMEGLLGEPVVMRSVRGHWHDFKGIPLMATYHPAYLLRNQSMSEKRKVWEDMLMVLEQLGEPISAKQRGYFLPKA